MPYPEISRTDLVIKKLSERKSKVLIARDHVPVASAPRALSIQSRELVRKAADRIRRARDAGSSVMLTFGAHTIKNGMAPTLIALIKDGWVTHLATNGAGIIHDWEFAFQGMSSEDVRSNVHDGQFGIWDETGYFINLGLIVGAFEGLGYGESIGRMISRECLEIPDVRDLYAEIDRIKLTDPDRCAAIFDLLSTLASFNLNCGSLKIPHPYKQYSIQASAYELKIPFTGHPMFGHDIIYNHPMNSGAAIGRTALRDFLCFAESVTGLERGVYLSVGSAVMSPMIFEKSLSMAQNLAIQHGKRIENHYMLVVDLAEANWDWHRDGEPPVNHAAYYLRYCKTFSRMGGEMDYLTMDNRDFLLALHQELQGGEGGAV